VRKITIHYRAHNGVRRAAVVVLPSWYGPNANPPIPLIISPHGRGVSGRTNAANWGALPDRGTFAVVSPDGQGRKLARLSWGYAGQVDDLARMPGIVRATLPWVQIDRSQVYVFGSSMGGQEALLLLARHPRLLAGVAAFDSVTDFARQYRNFPRLKCSGACRRAWKIPFGRGLQGLARTEVGGPPRTVPRRYARRSPVTYARRIAASCVPLQLWWSVSDRVVVDQQRQSLKLFYRLSALNAQAPIHTFIGFWRHSREMQARTRLPLALATFGLLPEDVEPSGVLHLPPAGPDGSCAANR
jgi:pimeloyl-ACP methyl ester carboxylesterase